MHHVPKVKPPTNNTEYMCFIPITTMLTILLNVQKCKCSTIKSASYYLLKILFMNIENIIHEK